MTKATDKHLGEIHGRLAKVMLNSLEQSTKAVDLLAEYQDDLPDEVIKFLSKLSAANPAMLTAVSKFLKDNSITCAVEDNDDMSELQKRLQDKHKRKRIGNVVPIED